MSNHNTPVAIGRIMARVLCYLGDDNAYGKDYKANIYLALHNEGIGSATVYGALEALKRQGLVMMEPFIEGDKTTIDVELTDLGYASLPLAWFMVHNERKCEGWWMR